MSATSPKAILADTSYPTAGRASAEQSPKSWMNVDFLWAEDVVFAWRGIAAFGGLLLLTSLFYWAVAFGYGTWTPGPFIGLIVLCFIASGFVAFLGRTEITLALFATIGVTIGLAVLDAPSHIPSAGALFTDTSTVMPDLDTVLALWVAGVILLLVGAVQSVRTARVIDDDV